MIARSIAVLAAATLLPFPTPGRAQAARGESLLISAEELVRNLEAPGLVLLHVGPKADYDAGHIRGARFVQMQDLSAPRVLDGLSLELPPAEELRARLEQLGIGDRSRVVVVPGEDWGSPATRIVFTLQAAGLGDRTRLLNGGMRGWKGAGLPVTIDVPPPATAARLTASPDRSIVVDRDFIRDRLASSGFKLVDARAPIFYDGPGMREADRTVEAGHIAGAINIPFNTMFDDQVRMTPRDELRRRFTEAGIRPGETIVAYCHIGQQATAVLFAARVLGHPIRLYDGSMNEWELTNGPVVNERRSASPSR